MGDLALTIGCARYDTTRALLDGRIGFTGIDATMGTAATLPEIFERLVHGGYDAAEFGLTFYLRTLEAGAPFVALPVHRQRAAVRARRHPARAAAVPGLRACRVRLPPPHRDLPDHAHRGRLAGPPRRAPRAGPSDLPGLPRCEGGRSRLLPARQEALPGPDDGAVGDDRGRAQPRRVPGGLVALRGGPCCSAPDSPSDPLSPGHSGSVARRRSRKTVSRQVPWCWPMRSRTPSVR